MSKILARKISNLNVFRSTNVKEDKGKNGVCTSREFGVSRLRVAICVECLVRARRRGTEAQISQLGNVSFCSEGKGRVRQSVHRRADPGKRWIRNRLCGNQTERWKIGK